MLTLRTSVLLSRSLFPYHYIVVTVVVAAAVTIVSLVAWFVGHSSVAQCSFYMNILCHKYMQQFHLYSSVFERIFVYVHLKKYYYLNIVDLEMFNYYQNLYSFL